MRIYVLMGYDDGDDGTLLGVRLTRAGAERALSRLDRHIYDFDEVFIHEESIFSAASPRYRPVEEREEATPRRYWLGGQPGIYQPRGDVEGPVMWFNGPDPATVEGTDLREHDCWMPQS